MATLPWSALNYQQDLRESKLDPRVAPEGEGRSVPTPDLKVVESSARRFSIPAKVLPSLILLITGAGMMATLLARSEMAVMQVQMQSVSKSLASATAKNEILNLEVSRLAAPQRIVDYASSKLGLVFPTSVNVVGGSTGNIITKSIPVSQGNPLGVPLPAGSQVAPAGVVLPRAPQGSAASPTSTTSVAGTTTSNSGQASSSSGSSGPAPTQGVANG